MSIAILAARAETLEAKARVEYRDLEFRSILNRCNSPRMPFDWTINPYRGCEFGCQYCYARYTHEYMELPGDAFEQKIFAKQGAGAVLRRELARGVGQGRIAIGTATDPYQPAERRFGVTREILQTLAEARGLHISITTKGDLIPRDIPLLQQIARANSIHVNMTIVTLDDRLARSLEPRAPRPTLRLFALRALREAGIDAGVFAMPVLPAITDRPASLDALFAAAASCGAQFVATNVLFLMPCAQKQFYPYLEREFPWLVERYRRRYNGGAYAQPEYRRRLGELVERLRQKHGLASLRDEYIPEELACLPKQHHRLGTAQLPLFRLVITTAEQRDLASIS